MLRDAERNFSLILARILCRRRAFSFLQNAPAPGRRRKSDNPCSLHVKIEAWNAAHPTKGIEPSPNTRSRGGDGSSGHEFDKVGTWFQQLHSITSNEIKHHHLHAPLRALHVHQVMRDSCPWQPDAAARSTESPRPLLSLCGPPLQPPWRPPSSSPPRHHTAPSRPRAPRE